MIIYDVEILRPWQDEEHRPIQGIEYCYGPTDLEGMDLACVCAYDYREDRYRVFTKGNLSAFADLIERREVVVGFNSEAFDNPIMEYQLPVFLGNKSYDLLQAIWKGAGLGPTWTDEHRGFSLDNTCRVNFGVGKTGEGYMAPVYWQHGLYGQVIDYCLEDVRLTKMLLDKVLRDEWILNPRDRSEQIPVAIPITSEPLTVRMPRGL